MRSASCDPPTGATSPEPARPSRSAGDDDSRTKREKPKASLLITSRLSARFAFPTGVACDDGHGGAVVADSSNHRIRQIRNDGVTVTVAGLSARGLADGVGGDAQFDRPFGITYDARDNRYLVVDEVNAVVRSVSLRSDALIISAAEPSGRRPARAVGDVVLAFAMALLGASALRVGSRAVGTR